MTTTTTLPIRWAVWIAGLAALAVVGTITSGLIDPIHHTILIGGGLWLGAKFPR